MRTRLRSRFAASLLVFPALALGFAACGGDDNDKNVDKILDDAFTTPIKSADVTLDTEVDVEGSDSFKGPFKVKLSGPFQDNGRAKLPSFDFAVSAGGGGANFSGGLVSSGDNLFVNFQDQDYEVGEQIVKQVNDAGAKAQDEQGGDGSLKSLGIDPRGWVKNGKDEGSEDVAGVETTHISAELDVPKMIDDLNELVEKSGDRLGGQLGPTPKPLTEDQKKKIEEVVGEPKFDVYVGKEDKALRRLSTDVTFEVPEGDRADVGGLEKGDVSFSIQFADVGDPVEIKAPTGARPLSQLIQQLVPGLGSQIPGLGGDSGGSSGGSGLVPPSGGSTAPDSGSTPPSSGGTPPSSGGPTPEVREKLQKFQKCVANADPSNTAARQKCLELLR